MTDYVEALTKALFDRLSDEVTLAPVYQHVPENTPPPVIIIGDISTEVAGGKTSDLERAEVDIVTVVQGPGRKPLNALQDQVKTALKNWKPSSAGMTFGEMTFIARDGRLLEGVDEIYYGTQRFSAFVQPL